jgi:hypothetical protein
MRLGDHLSPSSKPLFRDREDLGIVFPADHQRAKSPSRDEPWGHTGEKAF